MWMFYMAGDDRVIYNGTEMRRDYAESLAAAQRLTHYAGGRVRLPRIAFGNETYPMKTPGKTYVRVVVQRWVNFMSPYVNGNSVRVA